MPPGVGVGGSVACYEFICRMAQITAESQPPTLSVCLRARGDLLVCFCFCLLLSLPQCSCLCSQVKLSVGTLLIQGLFFPIHFLIQSLPFCSSSSSSLLLLFFFLVLLHLCSSPYPLILASAFYRHPRFSAMPFGGSVPHFPYIILRLVTVHCLQDLSSSNYMLIIIPLFRVRGENLVLLVGLAMGRQVCGTQLSIIQ